MNFLTPQSQFVAPNYGSLGYATNPFPRRGEVRAEIYAERREVQQLQAQLIAFVNGGDGGMWAIEGPRGVGKTNLLRHIEFSLSQVEESSSVHAVAYRYVGGLLVAPRQLAEQVVLAIGQDRLATWIRSRPAIPAYFEGTDLAHFVAASQTQQIDAAAEFLARWLSGQQTYSTERATYNIVAKDRLEPGTGFPYLRCIVEGLAAAGSLHGIVLLLDELEDLLALPTKQSAVYAMALKALVNTFNWKHLFVILAGQEGAFATLGARNTSLAGRWKIVRLRPLENAEQAVALAQLYMKTAAIDKSNIDVLQPSRSDILSIVAQSPQRAPVFQRPFLDALHTWVEERLAGPGQQSGVGNK